MRIRLARGSTALLLLGVLALGSCGGSKTEDLPPPNVLLITIDTLRADHLGTYGYSRGTSPHLDGLAARSVVFERTYSSSSWTLPSLSTLMTSQYTSTHRCSTNQSRLSDSFPTFAERFSSAGYRTGAVTTHVFLEEKFGLGQGFDEYDDDLVAATLSESHKAVTSPEITRRGLNWINARAAEDTDRPWLLWLHYFDPHSSYLAHEGISDAFGVDSPVDRYDGEIAFTDRAIGDVLNRLDELELYDDTIVVVLADHGEEFGDHGDQGHRHTLYEEVLRVPLILHVPEVEPQRFDQPIGTVDVYPTLLDLCGLEPEPDLEGRSLVPAMLGADWEPRLVLGELGRSRWDTLIDGRWKLLRQNGNERILLFDIEADPRETNDVSADHPERVAEMTETLTRMRKEKWVKGRSRAETIDLDEQDQRALSELGYGGDDEEEDEQDEQVEQDEDGDEASRDE